MPHHHAPASFLALLLLAIGPHSALAQTSQSPPPATQPAGQTVSQKIAASKTLLDINTATPDQLNALPGMGNAYTQRIIAGRPYTAKNQLTTRGVIPQAAYEKIKDQIIAHRPKQ
jgi:DNA uptake protein ComE-like DNA-binding protein